MRPILELKHISLSYHSLSGETTALEDITFDVQDGEFVSIVGPSGCGKSTLLSIVAGLLKPTSGSVAIDPKIKIGYMLQKDYLFSWRTIQKNAYLGLEIQNQLTPENKSYVDSLLEQYGLGEFKNHLPSQLSGGMRQRAALIRTLAIKPDILLLDEPFSALDYQTRLNVSDEIGTIIRKEKKTAVLVTHDISEAVSISDRVIVLSARPAVVKAIHPIILSVENKTPMKAREAPEFREYFNLIWKELDVHE